MTIHEKLTLSTLNFDACDRLLGYVYLDNSNLDTLKRKDKFDKMVSDGGKKLMNMIQKSNNNPSQIWEIPKGRKRNKPGETEYECAIREFREETLLPRDIFKVINNKKFDYTFISDGVTYKYVYYLAYYLGNNPPSGIPWTNKSQSSEVIDMKWLTLEEIRLLSNPSISCNEKLPDFIEIIFKVSKNYIKKSS
jgi:ADP-ribose pyrophosphatase YjhB (NUDIX family)